MLLVKGGSDFTRGLDGNNRGRDGTRAETYHYISALLACPAYVGKNWTFIRTNIFLTDLQSFGKSTKTILIHKKHGLVG